MKIIIFLFVIGMVVVSTYVVVVSICDSKNHSKNVRERNCYGLLKRAMALGIRKIDFLNPEFYI